LARAAYRTSRICATSRSSTSDWPLVPRTVEEERRPTPSMKRACLPIAAPERIERPLSQRSPGSRPPLGAGSWLRVGRGRTAVHRPLHGQDVCCNLGGVDAGVRLGWIKLEGLVVSQHLGVILVESHRAQEIGGVHPGRDGQKLLRIGGTLVEVNAHQIHMTLPSRVLR